MTRPYNFNPGPATLPAPVLEQVRDELLDYGGTGMSVMEMSHRSKLFIGIAEGVERRLRDLMGIPDDYAVLFLQGGATGQFAAVPLNLAREGATVDYLLTGRWSQKAADEAARFASVHVAASDAPNGYRAIPDRATWSFTDGAAYVGYAANETIGGVEFAEPPEVPGTLVGDLSSTILSRPLDVTRFGAFYAGAQKNLGPAGITVVVVRRDLLDASGREVPAVLDWRANADSGSMLNTPPTFIWYVVGLVLEWVEAQGGLPEMERRNRRKAEMLYAAIDSSAFYANPVDPPARSWMNVPFTLSDPGLDDPFLEEAAAAGLINLRGHRAVGGMRASLYNAMPEAGVAALVAFMQDFEQRHG